MRRVRFDHEAFVGQMMLTVAYRQVTWRQAAKEMGVPASCLTRVRQGHDPSIELFMRAIHWMGKAQMKLTSFLK